jgi:hypothetical protein
MGTGAAMEETGLFDGTAALEADGAGMAAETAGDGVALGVDGGAGAVAIGDRAVGTRRRGGQVRDILRDRVARADIGDADI